MDDLLQPATQRLPCQYLPVFEDPMARAVLTRQCHCRIRCFEYGATQQHKHYVNMLTMPEEMLHAELPSIRVQVFVVGARSGSQQQGSTAGAVPYRSSQLQCQCFSAELPAYILVSSG